MKIDMIMKHSHKNILHLPLIIGLFLCLFNISCDLFPSKSSNFKPSEPFEIQIEKTHGTIQGMHDYVDVTVNKGTEKIHGFDIRLAYDASALSFQAATVGTFFDECEWDYFTYRYGFDESCTNPHQTGMIRILGIANLDASNANCYGSPPYNLFSLDFLVSDDQQYDCMYLPIRFYWCDCGDNIIGYHRSSDFHDPYSITVGISNRVYDFEGFEITDLHPDLPNYFGTPDNCLDSIPAPVRYIDFINGGIDLICTGSTTVRGDLNLNGIANEIADAILFSNYFVYGPSVFEHNQQLYDVSDVNWDGIPSDISDLVYQINIIRGDALPYEAVQGTDTAQVYIVDNKLRIWGAPIGAAYVVVEGNVTPQLIFDQMEFKYAYDDVNDLTRILVYSFDGEVFYGGDLINYGDGNLLSIELATDIGEKIFVEIRPINKN